MVRRWRLPDDGARTFALLFIASLPALVALLVISGYWFGMWLEDHGIQLDLGSRLLAIFSSRNIPGAHFTPQIWKDDGATTG
jgi:hypothetical protein